MDLCALGCVEVGSLRVVGKAGLWCVWLLGVNGWCVGGGPGRLVVGVEFRRRWLVWVRSVVTRFANASAVVFVLGWESCSC
jgi:hypothetical protein